MTDETINPCYHPHAVHRATRRPEAERSNLARCYMELYDSRLAAASEVEATRQAMTEVRADALERRKEVRVLTSELETLRAEVSTLRAFIDQQREALGVASARGRVLHGAINEHLREMDGRLQEGAHLSLARQSVNALRKVIGVPAEVPAMTPFPTLDTDAAGCQLPAFDGVEEAQMAALRVLYG
jgi:molybdopterin converting factor small subunit